MHMPFVKICFLTCLLKLLCIICMPSLGIEVPFSFVCLEEVPCVHPAKEEALEYLQPREQRALSWVIPFVPLSATSLGPPDPSEGEIRSV